MMAREDIEQATAPASHDATTAAMPVRVMRETMNMRFLVADDHPSVTLAVRQILSDLLGIDPSQFSSVSTSAELLAACGTPGQCSFVVLDLVMPGSLKRVALVSELRAANPDLRMLVYTAEESPFLAQAVLDAGALAFVAKTSPAAELMDAVVAVLRGEQYVDTHINLERLKGHAWLALTDSEHAVLLALCRGEKMHEIVATTGRTYSTVSKHKYNGLTKLGLEDGNDLLPYIYEHGLLYELDLK